MYKNQRVDDTVSIQSMNMFTDSDSCITIKLIATKETRTSLYVKMWIGGEHIKFSEIRTPAFIVHDVKKGDAEIQGEQELSSAETCIALKQLQTDMMSMMRLISDSNRYIVETLNEFNNSNRHIVETLNEFKASLNR